MELSPEVIHKGARGPGTPYALPIVENGFVDLFSLTTVHPSRLIRKVVKSDRGFFNPNLADALNASTGGRIFQFDVNGDDRPDIVSLTAGGKIIALMNNGNMTYGGPKGSYSIVFENVAFGLDFAVNSTSRIFSGDFTSGTYTDLLIVRANGTLQVLQGTTNGFSTLSETNFASLGSRFSASSNSIVLAANFFGDSASEVAVTDPDTGSIYILLPDGLGGFTTPMEGATSRSAFKSPAWTAAMSAKGAANWYAGDFDGDAEGSLNRHKELLFTWTDGTVWLGKVTGSTSSPSIAWTKFANVPSVWSKLALTKSSDGWTGLADMNSDGRDDLIYAAPNGSVWVIHSGSGTNPIANTPMLYFNDAAMAGTFNGKSKNRFITANFDGDENGLPDLMILTSDGDFKLLSNKGDGFSWLAHSANWHSKPEWGISHNPAGSAASFFVADLNDDKLSDLTVTSPNGEIVTLKAIQVDIARTDITGEWPPVVEDPTNNAAPFVPVAAMAVLPNGKLWMIGTSLSEWPLKPNQDLALTYLNSGRLWDLGDWSNPSALFPISGIVQNLPFNAENIFCGSHAFSLSGQLVSISGLFRTKNVTLFDHNFPSQWKTPATMTNGRYYPTLTPLADGRLLATSGTYYKPGGGGSELFNKTAEILTFTGSSSVKVTQTPAGNQQGVFIPMWPNIFLAPDGRIFKAGPDTSSRFFDIENGFWSTPIAISSRYRFNGPAVEFGNGKIMLIGGANTPGEDNVLQANGDVLIKAPQNYAPGTNYPAGSDEPILLWYKNRITASAEAIDLTQPKPSWRTLPEMTYARFRNYATVLPDGKILVTGGTAKNTEGSSAIYPELFDPASESWSLLAPMAIPRLYHSAAMLLPDARVLVAGSSEPALTPGALNQPNFQFFKPPYLFKNVDGKTLPADRPVIASAPGEVTHGDTFTINMKTNAAAIKQLAWIRLPSLTHSWNPNQHFVTVQSFTSTGNSISMRAPLDGNAAQPGHYMLFALDQSGVPSVAKIIRIKPISGDLPPTSPPIIRPPADGSSAYIGQGLVAGRFLSNVGQGGNCSFTATMQADGNFVIYRGTTPLWSSNTSGNSGAKLLFQSDGNLVVYKANGVAAWSSNSSNKGATRLTIQGDGNLVLYTTEGNQVWASGTSAAGCIDERPKPTPTPAASPSPTAIPASTEATRFLMIRAGQSVGATVPSSEWISLDLNGDGKTDLLRYWNEVGFFSADGYISSGSTVKVVHMAAKSGPMFANQKWFKGDFNGDGKDDMAKLFNDGGSTSIDIHPSNGNSLGLVRALTRAMPFVTDPVIYPLDFNGDGVRDIGRPINDGGFFSVPVYLSTRSSLMTMKNWATKMGSFSAQNMTHVGDFNGDGKSDFAKIKVENGQYQIDFVLAAQ